MAYLLIDKERNKVTVAGNHENKETESLHFVQFVSEVSSVVGNPV